MSKQLADFQICTRCNGDGKVYSCDLLNIGVRCCLECKCRDVDCSLCNGTGTRQCNECDALVPDEEAAGYWKDGEGVYLCQGCCTGKKGVD